MKEKKNIIFLVVAILIFIVALIFAFWSFKTNVKIENKNSSLGSEDIKTNTVEEEAIEEPSQTKDLDATYTDFTVKNNANGTEEKLSDYKDMPVMLIFWNQDNEDAVEMLNRVNQQYNTYQDKIHFMAIHTEQTQLKNVEDIAVPIYFDTNGEIAKQYHVTELPAMVYINKNNEVFNAKTGLTTVDALTANLDILAENF